MTKNEIEQARKDAERFGKFAERIAGIETVCRVALEVQEQALQLEKTVAGLTAEEARLLAVCAQLTQDAATAQATHDALLVHLATEEQAAHAASLTRLDQEAEDLRASYSLRYSQLEQECTLLETLKTETVASLALLDSQIAERQGTLRTVQAQLQAMLVGGAA